MAYHFLQNIAHGANTRLLAEYRKLQPFAHKTIAEYIWIGGSGLDIRSKSRTLDHKITDVHELPIWHFDGSSTGQAEGKDSEVTLKPVRICRDPFRLGENILVLCECTKHDGTAIPSNHRAFARSVFDDETVKKAKTWFGLEQEYTLFTPDGLRPLGFPSMGLPLPQGPYYCSVGVENAYGRHISEAHYFASLYAGLEISGTNAEVMPGSWEFQIGPSEGIDAPDQLWLARYLLEKICEDFQVKLSLQPKPLKEWNGAGCHCNFSTESMRNENGLSYVEEAIKLLEKKHKEHINVYGKDNNLRLTGAHETASIDRFSWGYADRGASIRVTRETKEKKRGYLEDRRPAANCDPYQVCGMIAKTCIQDNKKLKKEAK